MGDEMFTDDTLWVVRENAKLKKANAREKRRKSILTDIRKRKEEYSRKGRKSWEDFQRHPFDNRHKFQKDNLDEAEY